MNSTELIDRLSRGEPEAIRWLWGQANERLLPYVRSKVKSIGDRALDAEDVLIAVFSRLCSSLQKNAFANLQAMDDLWTVLMVLTKRQLATEARRQTATKRGGRMTRRSWSAAHDTHRASATATFVYRDTLSQAIADLGVDELREVALLRIEGHDNSEIAARLNVSLRTVERRISIIRERWKDRFEFALPPDAASDG